MLKATEFCTICKRFYGNRVVFQINPLKPPVKSTKAVKILKSLPKEVKKVSDIRFNELNIQMLPRNIHQQLFKNYPKVYIDYRTIDKCREELGKNSMISSSEEFENVKLNLPELKGNTLEEHFLQIGNGQIGPYKNVINKLLKLKQLPEKPKEWIFQSGWTRYLPGLNPEKVDYPLEQDLIFDVEVCVQAGKKPTLACAVSSKAWYCWVSEDLINTSTSIGSQCELTDLIPFESIDGNVVDEIAKKPKIIIGHNVSYDRARIKEQYFLKQTALRFLDTMSLHICVSGMTSYQRAMLKSKDSDDLDEEWKANSSLNNLSDVHNLYCGTEVTKEKRDLFVKGTLQDIRDNFGSLVNYCANDVAATYDIFKVIFPMFEERFPHPVSLAGMLELSVAYLPINQNWERYIEECDLTFEDLDIEGRNLLKKKADEACYLMHDDEYKRDIWMWDLDWSVKELQVKKSWKPPKISAAPTVPTDKSKKSSEDEDEEEPDPLEEKFKYLEDMKGCTKKVTYPGFPSWYRDLCLKPGSTPEWTPGAHRISTSMKITPKLLNLTWEGFPLHYIREHGWGFLVPICADKENTKIPLRELWEKCPLVFNKEKKDYVPANILADVEENLSRKEYYSKLKKTKGEYKGSGVWCNVILGDCVHFYKLPHKDGPNKPVGNPLAKDFLNKFSENVLAGDGDVGERVLELARSLSYWKNNHDRIRNQMVIYTNPERTSGAILPQIVVAGTLTRRAVEPTWMTASNANLERIGSELRAMVQAPKGYKIVGADVDSQELWISSVIGDAKYTKMHGGTPYGWMTLSGNKSNGTDMHSVTAKAVGISRDHAKVINYARIYGAGQRFAEQLLRQFNPLLSEREARNKATIMFNLTKGKRVYRIRPQFLGEFEDVLYNKWKATEIARLHGKRLEQMFHMPQWIGGTESAMFNSLEAIATELTPKTPFLESRLSRALEPASNPDEKFLPTRINWVVQSGAVDFLHLMLVCMRWLMGDKARFLISFHDEVRYLVSEEHQYEAALAMHITNLLTRAFCSAKLGIYDLPYSVAFFSSVEVDDALRKDCKQEYKTPSNPYGLSQGYGINHGESLTIQEAIIKAKNECQKQRRESTF